MEEILFRGYDGGDWVYSKTIAQDEADKSIWWIWGNSDEWLMCGKPQLYTGIHDIHGVKIFEGDILSYLCGGTKQDKPYVVESVSELWNDIGIGQGDGYYSMSGFEIIDNVTEKDL